MSKSVLAAAIAIACFAFAACSPTAESTGGSLEGKTWQWTTSTAADGGSEAVENPEDHTLVFLKGSFTVKADCNSVSGTWRSTDSGDLTLKPTSSTDKTCEPGSLSDAYVEDLSSAASYAFEDGKLVVTLADERTMTFE